MSEQHMEMPSSSIQKVAQQGDSPAKQKISIYLTEEQVQRLADLEHEYNKRLRQKKSK